MSAEISRKKQLLKIFILALEECLQTKENCFKRSSNIIYIHLMFYSLDLN